MGLGRWAGAEMVGSGIGLGSGTAAGPGLGAKARAGPGMGARVAGGGTGGGGLERGLERAWRGPWSRGGGGLRQLTVKGPTAGLPPLLLCVLLHVPGIGSHRYGRQGGRRHDAAEGAYYVARGGSASGCSQGADEHLGRLRTCGLSMRARGFERRKSNPCAEPDVVRPLLELVLGRGRVRPAGGRMCSGPSHPTGIDHHGYRVEVRVKREKTV